jgi:hypothetical protein
MSKSLVFNLKDTKIPCDPCPCKDAHFIICKPKDYDKKTMILKKGARYLLFSIPKHTRKTVVQEIIKEAEHYQFK